ncbi:MAG: biopolymer transporter ExbD [Acidiphilium sp. 37-67-22]|nr:MAG: biopolymer transporter ExbD [Acidiphilium sp. 37-67-22]
MNMRYFEARKARVEIIPMIDVMLFLLVFFIIVTLQMIPDAGIPMQLPNSTQTTHLKHPKFTVNILADGSIQVKKQVLTPDQLTAMFQGDGDPSKTEVTIAASKAVAFQHFVTVMDAARKAGVTDIGIAAQPVAGAAASPAGGMPAAAAPAAPAAAPAAPASGN